MYSKMSFIFIFWLCGYFWTVWRLVYQSEIKTVKMRLDLKFFNPIFSTDHVSAQIYLATNHDFKF